jgi:hypothetical protein
MSDVRCLGCGAMVPERGGPTHAYMLSAAGCWERYCSLEDWKAGLTGEQAIVTVQDLGTGSFGAAAARPYRDLGRAGVPRAGPLPGPLSDHGGRRNRGGGVGATLDD